MAGVDVAGSVLEWAERRSGRDGESRKKFSHWDDWVAQRTKPTVAQVETIANFTRVPFGYFFFSEPPYEELPTPDFRVGRGHHVEASVDLLETIGLNQRRQAWYEDYLTDFNDPESLDFVGSARGMAPAEAAVLMTKVLRYSVSERKDLRTADEARRYLVEAFEDLGGLVVMNSMVGNNTHQMLSLDEFRGFTLHSQFAPLVFVNSNDTKAGQVSPSCMSSPTSGGVKVGSARAVIHCVNATPTTSAGVTPLPRALQFLLTIYA
ncbi:hypothetical protein [Cutibacterium sp. V947]|uniref:hypothetical protein n=1 Tax=Cutibacterium sp. V947 TaxID=3446480 RepID=UPI003EDF4C9E